MKWECFLFKLLREHLARNWNRCINTKNLSILSVICEGPVEESHKHSQEEFELQKTNGPIVLYVISRSKINYLGKSTNANFIDSEGFWR